MSETDDTPLSKAIAQGWEVANYSASFDPAVGLPVHCFLLRRQGRNRLLIVRPKMMGEGLVVEHLEL